MIIHEDERYSKEEAIKMIVDQFSESVSEEELVKVK